MYGNNYYGMGVYGLPGEQEGETQHKYVKLTDYLTSLYDKNISSNVYVLLNKVVGEELLEVKNKTSENANSRVIYKGKNEELIRWEEEMGVNNKNLSMQERISFLHSKLQNRGSATLQDIKKFIKNWLGDDNVIIHEHSGDFFIIIEFVDYRGRIEDKTDFLEALDQLIPAHLEYDFIVTLTTHGDIENMNFRHDELSQYEHRDVEEIVKIEQEVK